MKLTKKLSLPFELEEYSKNAKLKIQQLDETRQKLQQEIEEVEERIADWTDMIARYNRLLHVNTSAQEVVPSFPLQIYNLTLRNEGGGFVWRTYSREHPQYVLLAALLDMLDLTGYSEYTFLTVNLYYSPSELTLELVEGVRFLPQHTTVNLRETK